jgi:ferredoxin
LVGLRVWIDQDLCTGDGLCTDHCPEIFRLLDDGISYVVGANGVVHNRPGGAAEPALVPDRLTDAVIAAADHCPGECIFLEEHSSAAGVTWAEAHSEVDLEPDPGELGSESAVESRGGSGWPRTVQVNWRRDEVPHGT